MPRSKKNRLIGSLSVNRGSLLKSTFWGVGISLFVSIGTFSFNVLVARNLNVRDFATFVAVMTFINLVGLVFSGFQVSVAREIAQNKVVVAHKKLDSFTKSLLYFSLGLASALFLSQQFWNLKLGLSTSLVIVLCLIFPSSAVLIILNGRLAGLGRFKEQAAVSLSLVSANLAVQLLQAAIWGVSLERAIWTQIAINFLIGITLLLATNKVASVSQLAFSQKNIQTALMVAMFGFICNFDLLLSPLFLSEAERGHYSAASGISKYLLIFFTMINATLFTALNRNKAANQSSFSILKKSGFALSGLVSLFLVAVYFFGPTGLVLLYGDQYSLAASNLFLICLCYVPMVFASWLLQLVYMRITWFPVITLFLLISTSLAFAFISKLSIPTLSILVAITGSAICITLVGYLFFLRKTGKWNLDETG